MEPDEIAALKFEEALAALEEAVKRLESGNLDLDEALATYSTSMALAKHCDHLLEQAELRVSQLVETETGTVQEVPF